LSEKKEEQENIEETEQPEICETEVEAQEEVQEEETQEPSLEEKLKEAEDKYLRVHADFENIKRRMEKEKIQAIAWANESFASDLLTVIDSLDMAIKIDNKDAFEDLKKGVELTKDNLVKAFEKHGIKEIPTEDGFDPNLHEAVMQVESEEHNEKDIVQVLQKGYTCKEKVIRPTMVSICK
jgi:molecular chaperone GrpE